MGSLRAAEDGRKLKSTRLNRLRKPWCKGQVLRKVGGPAPVQEVNAGRRVEAIRSGDNSPVIVGCGLGSRILLGSWD